MNAPDPIVGAGHAVDGMVRRDPPDQARLRQLADEQAALRRVATLVARGAAPEEVFTAVAGEVGQLFRVELATLFRYEPGRTATTVTTWGPAGENLSVGIRWPVEGHNVTTLVFETGRPARVDRYPDNSSGPLSAVVRETGIRSAVGTPVIVEGSLWGAIFAGSTLEQHVELDVPGATLRLTIRDDGIGGADPARGSGLTGLRDRIEAVGGTFNVTSPAGGGTTLLIEIPVQPAPGTLEFQTKSGATFTIRPGDILLAQDNSGTGHKWKLIGDDPWRRAYVVYANGADLHFKPATASR